MAGVVSDLEKEQVMPGSSTARPPAGVTSRLPGCRSPCHRLSWNTWCRCRCRCRCKCRCRWPTIWRSMSAPLAAMALHSSPSAPGASRLEMEVPATQDSTSTRLEGVRVDSSPTLI